MQSYDDDNLREMLTGARVIAVVGHSDSPERTSYQIGRWLQRAGYTVYPVNPTVSQIDGQTCYATLADVPEPVDIVNVFRRSEYLAGVVGEAAAIHAGGIWAQLGVEDEGAASQAQAAGMTIVMDRCIKVEHLRLNIGSRSAAATA